MANVGGMGMEYYKTKDIWVGMCLLALGERLVKVEYNEVADKVFFVFATPPSKGRALEAMFASKDETLALPVVKLHNAYEQLHRWRVLISKTRQPLALQDVYNEVQELQSEMKNIKVPKDLDEALEFLQGGEDNEESE